MDRDRQVLLSRGGPHWLEGFVGVPEELPGPLECELEPWAVDLFSEFETEATFSDILTRYGDRVPADALAVLLTQAELANILAPLDVATRIRRRTYTADFLARSAG